MTTPVTLASLRALVATKNIQFVDTDFGRFHYTLLTGAQRAEFSEEVRTRSGKKDAEMSAHAASALQVVLCHLALTNESGRSLFTSATEAEEVLLNIPALVLDQVTKAIMDANGLSPAGKDKLEGN